VGQVLHGSAATTEAVRRARPPHTHQRGNIIGYVFNRSPPKSAPRPPEDRPKAAASAPACGTTPDPAAERSIRCATRTVAR
jgi:hypothetical protein